jgi:hypothetical protein
MYAVRRVTKTRHATAKAILKSGMILVTQDRVPGKQKGGAYALLMKSGLVWYSHTSNFNQMLVQTRHKAAGPECVKQAWAAGERVDIYVLTKPEQFCGVSIRQQLADADLLAARKTRDMTGPGHLYVVRHDCTHDYFVVEDRGNTPETSILSFFLSRLQTMSNTTLNVALNNFVTAQAADILAERNFSITQVAKFDDVEDAWLKRQVYIDDCRFGNNLNWKSVD